LKALISSEAISCGEQINAVVLDGLWRQRLVAEGTVRPKGIVVPAPLFDEQFCPLQRIEHLTVVQLVAQLAVEILIVSSPMGIKSRKARRSMTSSKTWFCTFDMTTASAKSP